MGPDNRRLLIAVVLSASVLMAWNLLFPPQKPKPPATPPAEVTQQAKPPEGAAPPAPQGGPTPSAPVVPTNTPEELVRLDGAGFDVVLTSHGGAISSLVLEGEKFQRGDRDEAKQIDLIRVAKGQPHPLAVTAAPEAGGAADPGTDPAATAPMRIVARDAQSVTFEGQAGNLAIRKTYRLTGKPYELAFELSAKGGGQGAALFVLYPGFMPPDTESGGFFSGPPVDFVRPVCRTPEGTERFDVGGDDAMQRVEGAAAWAGLDQGYFISAVLPSEAMGTCVFAKGPENGSALTALRLPVDGGGRTWSFTVYSGPKDLDHLRAYGRGFESAIDYGAMARPFAFFARLLLYVMRWFEKLVANWGVAIILLTLLVKLLLYPLTAKSTQSMNEMRKLQPEIEKLKAKHGNDREKLNLATMQLYQQHKVNPLGGCLPMLLQLPIWFALYATLQTSVELYREPFLWIVDLTRKDPYYILPLAMGASSFVMQKLSPQPADAAQAKMMLYFMPALFTVMMLSIPAGLTLYIFVNNVLSIAQQQWMMRRMPAIAPVAAK